MPQKGLNAEERAYRSIIKLILSGHFRPGDFLLEVELAERLQMSRTPVSRALARLVVEGFLDKMPKKGCFIPVPTPEDATQVFRARIAVESEAAASAAQCATEEEIRHLEELVTQDEEAVRTLAKESFSAINEALHLGIARASRNAYLERWCRYIFWRSNLYVFYLDSFYRSVERSQVPPQKTPAQHRCLVQAIRERDPDQASRLMRVHIERSYEALLFRPEDPISSPI